MITTFPDAEAQAAILDKAADRLAEHGWIQGAMYDSKQADDGTPLGECRTDLLGALKAAVLGEPRWGGSLDDITVVDLALTALRQHLGAEPLAWNDADDRTADEVQAALRATAARLRGEA